jgi:hypothetical protein
MDSDMVEAVAIQQNDAMRQELSHVANLVSDMARAMRVDLANDDGSWPDLSGRIQRLTEAAIAAHTGKLIAERDALVAENARLGLAASEAIMLIDEINERATSRVFYGITQVHGKLCTIRATLARAPAALRATREVGNG